MEYRIVSVTSLEGLVAEVKDYIRLGWIPQGGLAIAPAHSAEGFMANHYWAQAMIKMPPVPRKKSTGPR